MTSSTEIRGRLVLDSGVSPGRIRIEGDRITAVDVDTDPGDRTAAGRDGPRAAPAVPTATALPIVSPGFVDVHVHGWGGHDAMGSVADLDGMARALLRRGVTSFLPTAVTAPLGDLRAFADRVRTWIPGAAADGAEPLGFNLEGPFLARKRKGAHSAEHLVTPADVPWSDLEPLMDGLRLITIAPEIDGALDLIRRLADLGVRVSLGHSAATLAEAVAGYEAGAMSTTHLFNAMSGIGHRAPGLAGAALTRDDVWVELIADGQHVDPVLWAMIQRTKPEDRMMLVSDAIALAGTGDGRTTVGGLQVEVRGDRCTLVDGTLAGSVIALDSAVRNVTAEGSGLAAAVRSAAGNPLAMLGILDRGKIAVGQRADLIELDDDLMVRRVMRAGVWRHG